MSNDDDEDKTPNRSGSFAAFFQESLRIAKRLRIVAFAQERNGSPATEVEVTRTLAEKADWLADRFEKWPRLPPGTVGEERNQKISELLDLNRACEELASKTPGVPPPPVSVRPLTRK